MGWHGRELRKHCQPYSDEGSVGWPMCGVQVCDARGEVLWQDQDTWSRGRESPEPQVFAWGAGQEPVVYRLWTPPWCQVAGREDLAEISFDTIWATVSPDGQLVGLLDAQGRGALLRRGSEELYELEGPVLALDLSQAPLVGVLREGGWQELVAQ